MQFGVWGLSFKPETDDMREAPSFNLIHSIIKAGGEVNAYDPKAIQEAKSYLKEVNVTEMINITSKNFDNLFLLNEN